MSPATARCLIAAVATITIALEVAAVALIVGKGPIGVPVLYAVNATAQVVAGAVIVWAYPRHRIGWLLAAFAVGNALVADAAWSYGLRGSGEGCPAPPMPRSSA